MCSTAESVARLRLALPPVCIPAAWLPPIQVAFGELWLPWKLCAPIVMSGWSRVGCRRPTVCELVSGYFFLLVGRVRVPCASICDCCSSLRWRWERVTNASVRGQLGQRAESTSQMCSVLRSPLNPDVGKQGMS